jgi:hypothetical protein
MIRHVSVHAVPKLKLRLEEIDNLEATAIFHDCNNNTDNYGLVLENASGVQYLIDFPYSFSNGPQASLQAFDILKVRLSADNERVEVLDKSNNSFYGRQKPGTHSLDKFAKFYKILKCVKSETYL